MLIVLGSFSVIANVVMMANDRWLSLLLSAYIHSFYVHIQKEKRKKRFLHSYHSVLLLIHSQIFNFSFVIYVFFSIFFFSFLVHVNRHKLYRSMEQFYCYVEITKTYLHWVNGLSQKKPSLIRWLSCTQHTKQNKERKF